MAGLVGTEAIANDLETKISNALRYIANIDDPVKEAGAQEQLNIYQNDLKTVLSMDPEYDQSAPAPAPASEPISPSLSQTFLATS
jgi:hypothetical protein